MDEEKHRGAFFKWLLQDRENRQSCMLDRAQGEKVIQYLKAKRNFGEDDPYMRSNYDCVFSKTVKKKCYKLLTVVGLGDILCLPLKQGLKKSTGNHAMLGQNRQVIFKEDMYDVIRNAHMQGTKHLGYKGTYNKLNETYCGIPRVVVCKFVELCDFCAVHHACYASKHQKKSGQREHLKITRKPKRKMEFPDAFLTRCQIDIIDMTKAPDKSFCYIGHFFDHHTKYNILFPLKTKDSLHVGRKLCRHVFGHFGLPKILYSNMPRGYVDDLISWVSQLWSDDKPIINGDPENKNALPFIEQRQKTILVLIQTFRTKQSDSNDWAAWLPCIQYSLNSNEFEQDIPPSYDAVFKARSRCFSHGFLNSRVLWEESLIQVDDDDNDEGDVNCIHNPNELSTSVTVAAAAAIESRSPIFKTAVPDTIVNMGVEQAQESLPEEEIISDPTSTTNLVENVS